MNHCSVLTELVSVDKKLENCVSFQQEDERKPNITDP